MVIKVSSGTIKYAAGGDALSVADLQLGFGGGEC
jgi:hypothetical protein